MLAGLVSLLSACQGDSPTSTNAPPEQRPPVTPKATTLTVAPDSVALGAAGDTARFTATVKDQNGNIMSGLTVAWSSSDTAVAKVSSSGLVTSVNTGAAVISASLKSLKAEKRAVVKIPPKATSISLSPDSLVVGTWGDTARFATTVRDQNGNAMSGFSVTWASSDTSVARVDASGRVTSRKAGQAMISASIEGLKAERKIAVMLQMNARCKVPTGFPTKGGVAGSPSFVRASQAFDVQSPRYGMKEIAPGDFDGDGDQDIMVFSSNFPPAVRAGEVLFWRNVGGNFVEATSEAFGDAKVVADHTRHIEIADLNGDRLLDVFAAQHGYDTSPWDGAPDLLILSQGGGKVREVSATNLSPYEKNNYTHASAAGDIDCDGDVDLFAGSGGGMHGSQSHHLYVNSGTGSFTAEDARIPDVKIYDVILTSALLCDFDRDGDPEMYLGGSHDTEDRLLVNDGFGKFRAAPPGVRFPKRYGITGNTVDLHCSDVNRDGWMDLVIAGANKEYGTDAARGGFDVWINRGDLRFENATASLVPNEVVQDWNWRAFPTDFNADGWPDIFAKSNVGRDKLYINQGGTRFVSMDAPAQYLSWVDANGDQRMDLFWSGGTGPNGEQYTPVLYHAR